MRSTRSRTETRTLRGRLRTWSAFAVAGVTMVALAGCGSDDGGGSSSEAKLIEEGTLIAASSGEYRPFSYFEDGKLVGFDKDIADAVGKAAGLEVKTETGTFDTLIQGVQSNRYDVIIGSMTPTEKRDNAVDFTDGYYTSGAQMFVREGSDCTDPKKMDEPTIGVARGTTYQEYLEGEGWAGNVKTYASDVTALGDLATGRLDGVITDKLVGLYQIKKADKPLTTCGELLYEEEPAFAVKEGNAGLVEKLNKALAKVKDDGTYAKLSKKWFGQDIS